MKEERERRKKELIEWIKLRIFDIIYCCMLLILILIILLISGCSMSINAISPCAYQSQTEISYCQECLHDCNTNDMIFERYMINPWLDKRECWCYERDSLILKNLWRK
jgi:capsular polysaccharide biosynthesis protein